MSDLRSRVWRVARLVLVRNEMLHIDLVWYFLDDNGQASVGGRILRVGVGAWQHMVLHLTMERVSKGARADSWLQTPALDRARIL